MTNEELKNMLFIIDTLLDDAITDSTRQKVKDNLTEVCQLAIKALEQQPCEDTEVIKVSKGAVKARQGRFVIYDVDWLKKNFYATEEKIYGQPKQPSEDCISREHAKQFLYYEIEHLHDDSLYDCFARIIDDMYNELPSVTPTNEDIKEAYIKGYDYGVKDWFKSKTQPCEYAVSREAVDKFIDDKLATIEEWASSATNEGRWREEEKYLYGVEILEELKEYIEELPPVAPTSQELVEAYNLGYDIGAKECSKTKTEDAVNRESVEKMIKAEFPKRGLWELGGDVDSQMK